MVAMAQTVENKGYMMITCPHCKLEDMMQHRGKNVFKERLSGNWTFFCACGKQFTLKQAKPYYSSKFGVGK